MLMSWTAVSWSVTSYYRALRVSIAHPQSNNTERSLCSAIGYFCWRAFEIGPRIIAIAIFAAQFTYFVFAFFIIHWTCMILWLKCQKVKVYEKFGENLFFIVAVGIYTDICFHERVRRSYSISCYVVLPRILLRKFYFFSIVDSSPAERYSRLDVICLWCSNTCRVCSTFDMSITVLFFLSS